MLNYLIRMWYHLRIPAKLGWKLLALGIYMALLLLWLYFGLPCIPRLLLGVICPGCGLTRAWLSLLGGELAAAFRYHPMFWSIPVFVLFLLYDCRLFRNPRLNGWILGSLITAFILCYLVRLSMFLGGSLPI